MKKINKKSISKKPKKDYFSSDYSAVLTMGGKDYEGKGANVFDAITNIPLDWTQIKNKGTIRVSFGKKKVEKFFYLRILRMIFANKLRRKMQAIIFEKLLNAEAAPSGE